MLREKANPNAWAMTGHWGAPANDVHTEAHCWMMDRDPFSTVVLHPRYFCDPPCCLLNDASSDFAPYPPSECLSHKTTTNRRGLAVARPVAFFCRTRPSPKPLVSPSCVLYICLLFFQLTALLHSSVNANPLPSLTLVTPSLYHISPAS
jgi:hypothetical protein